MVLQHQIRLVIFLNTDFWTNYLIENSFSVNLQLLLELLYKFLYILKARSNPLIPWKVSIFLIAQMNQILSFVFAWYPFYFILVQTEINFTFCQLLVSCSFLYSQRQIGGNFVKEPLKQSIMTVDNVLRIHQYFVTDICLKNLLRIFHQIRVFVFFLYFLEGKLRNSRKVLKTFFNIIRGCT